MNEEGSPVRLLLDFYNNITMIVKKGFIHDNKKWKPGDTYAGSNVRELSRKGLLLEVPVEKKAPIKKKTKVDTSATGAENKKL